MAGMRSDGRTQLMNRGLGIAMLAGALGLGVPSSPVAEGQQLRHACDESGDGFIDGDEARMCRERAFDRVSAGDMALTEEDLSAMRGAEEGVGPAFADIDEDGDGAVSRDEWTRFGDRRFSGAAAASGGRMSVEDYDRWRHEGMPP
jgi:hypothetical protein